MMVEVMMVIVMVSVTVGTSVSWHSQMFSIIRIFNLLKNIQTEFGRFEQSPFTGNNDDVIEESRD